MSPAGDGPASAGSSGPRLGSPSGPDAAEGEALAEAPGGAATPPPTTPSEDIARVDRPTKEHAARRQQPSSEIKDASTQMLVEALGPEAARLLGSRRRNKGRATSTDTSTAVSRGPHPAPALLRPSLALRLHRCCTEGLQPDAFPGAYRANAVQIRMPGGQVFRPPAASLVPELMEDFFDELNGKINDSKTSCAAAVAFCLYRLTEIHPFRDANGRVSRGLAYLVMCSCLQRDPGTAALLPVQFALHRKECIAALRSVSPDTAGQAVQPSQDTTGQAPTGGQGGHQATGEASGPAAAHPEEAHQEPDDGAKEGLVEQDLGALQALVCKIWPAIAEHDRPQGGHGPAENPDSSEPSAAPQTHTFRADVQASAAANQAEALRPQLECNICTELMVDPVTAAQCGHTFCWICLKRWFLAKAGQPTCPMCRRRVEIHSPDSSSPNAIMPAVSINLRNLVRHLFPAEMEAREASVKAEIEAERLVSNSIPPPYAVVGNVQDAVGPPVGEQNFVEFDTTVDVDEDNMEEVFSETENLQAATDAIEDLNQDGDLGDMLADMTLDVAAGTGAVDGNPTAEDGTENTELPVPNDGEIQTDVTEEEPADTQDLTAGDAGAQLADLTEDGTEDEPADTEDPAPGDGGVVQADMTEDAVEDEPADTEDPTPGDDGAHQADVTEDATEDEPEDTEDPAPEDGGVMQADMTEDAAEDEPADTEDPAPGDGGGHQADVTEDAHVDAEATGDIAGGATEDVSAETEDPAYNVEDDPTGGDFIEDAADVGYIGDDTVDVYNDYTEDTEDL